MKIIKATLVLLAGLTLCYGLVIITYHLGKQYPDVKTGFEMLTVFIEFALFILTFVVAFAVGGVKFND